MVTIEVTKTTLHTITISISGLTELGSGEKNIEIYLDWKQIQVDGTQYGYYTVSGDEDSLSHTYEGLLINTYYTLGAVIYNSNFTKVLKDGLSVLDKTGEFPWWSWDYPNDNAYYAIKNRGNVSDFSSTVWNDLVYMTKMAIEMLGYSWDDEYAGYDATRMLDTKILTATRFNSLVYNIDLYSPSGTNIGEVETGDPVKGKYFITIADCLNEIIAGINGV